MTTKVPQSEYRTAIAIQHDERLTDVELTFLLQDQEGTTATYKARCPRCNEGEIVATLPLNADGSLPEDPAVPGFCLDCEERLDAILGTQDSRETRARPDDRATLRTLLKTMNVRPWD